MDTLTPDQKRILTQVLGDIGPGAIDTFQQFLRPSSGEEIQTEFQRSFVDPAMQTYQQQILPAIQQRYADVGASSSSALNQALAQSASDLSTGLGSQYGALAQARRGEQMGALQSFLPLVTGQTIQPYVQQKQGWLGPTIGAVGNIGAGIASGGLF